VFEEPEIFFFFFGRDSLYETGKEG
jgi:hypothetical protein